MFTIRTHFVKKAVILSGQLAQITNRPNGCLKYKQRQAQTHHQKYDLGNRKDIHPKV